VSIFGLKCSCISAKIPLLVEISTADLPLPSNLTENGEDRVAMSKYTLSLWDGQANTSSKWCMGFLNPGPDFSLELRESKDSDPYYNAYPNPGHACAPLLGQECYEALEKAFGAGLNEDCSGATGVWAGDIPACKDTWKFQQQDMSFIGNGKRK
jgi:hypothetical protein